MTLEPQEKPRLNPKLKLFWRTRARNRVLYGGRSSSKSWDAAGIAVQFSRMAKIRVLCTRQFQNKITESVYTLLKIQIERFGLQDEFDITNNGIKHKTTGSEFLFYGLWRHIDEIKSLESIDILWVEEAHNLTAAQWEILEPTIRKQGSQCWIVFNPRFATDFVYKHFVTSPPPDTICQLINYTDNPFLSETIMKVINAKRDEDFEEFQHIYLGVPRDNDDKAVIKRSWVMAAIDAHKTVTPSKGDWKGTGRVGGYDVADDGDDKNALTVMDGSVCMLVNEWKADTDELFKSTKRVHNVVKLLSCVSLGYDSIGVGAGTGGHLNELGYRSHFRFNAGSGVADGDKKYKDTKLTNQEYFSNLKAQAWWRVADRFRNTYLAVTKPDEYQFAADEMISISSECEAKLLNQLVDELATPFRDFDKAGRVKVESKDDLKKREIDSPNIADSFIIANSRGLTAKRSMTGLL